MSGHGLFNRRNKVIQIIRVPAGDDAAILNHGLVHHLGAGRHVIGVVHADGVAGHGLDDDLVAVVGQLARAGRKQADAIFLVLDFLRNADEHLTLP